MKNNRTFLEKLLDGAEVEWKPLGKVTDIKTGQSVSKNIIAQNPGIYPVINSGREPLGFINEWNTKMILLVLQQEVLVLAQLLGKKVNISEEILIIL